MRYEDMTESTQGNVLDDMLLLNPLTAARQNPRGISVYRAKKTSTHHSLHSGSSGSLLKGSCTEAYSLNTLKAKVGLSITSFLEIVARAGRGLMRYLSPRCLFC
jgi:hypothetical protein